ncbi:uncharacterized protein LOC129591232 [Paramacrobiotus metropolitanus]|uniref:uncharacterized protein LOC129591232 n=1 Tax=Paramacrobiotus metropolitanus TaxID=2943436 RepID=UPI0024458E29|nr:uncharacterized protein LOC129591232 [Paramacrobiotus metropolitanus]
MLLQQTVGVCQVCSRSRLLASRWLFIQAESRMPTISSSIPKVRPHINPGSASSGPSPTEKLSAVRRLWKYISNFGVFRVITGQNSMSAMRIQKLKAKDCVSPLAAMVYTYQLDGTLRTACTVVNIVFAFIVLSGIKWYLESGFRIKSFEEVDRTMAGNPIKFDHRYQYGIAVGFAFLTFFAVNFLRRRAILRGYYDSKTDLFTLVKITGLGRTTPFHIKAGHAKHVQREGFGKFLGNVVLLDADRSPLTSVILLQDNFLLPWYWNRLFDGSQQGVGDPLLTEYNLLARHQDSDEKKAQELSALNAKRIGELYNFKMKQKGM